VLQAFFQKETLTIPAHYDSVILHPSLRKEVDYLKASLNYKLDHPWKAVARLKKYCSKSRFLGPSFLLKC
jgi:hypothetical protein